ncbi:MAG: glycoside hydrolase family 25 protein [Ruminococcus sp.]|nr:glycoside hydrolase family 25 protein [Ruminococcus sp.]
MIRNGIDVSEHQGTIDWSKVNTDFVIIRAGYGREISQKDKQFETNYAGCKSRDIPCGAYWYSYATSVEDAKKEAAVCLEVIKGKQFEYPIYFDIEEERQFRLGKTVCSEITKAFCATLEEAGYWVGIYSSKSHLETYLSAEVRSRYTVWVAHYGVSKTTYSGDYQMWQKSAEGKIEGISGAVDLDECYYDYPTAIPRVGMNGFSGKVPEPEKDTIRVIVEHDGKVYDGKLTEI